MPEIFSQSALPDEAEEHFSRFLKEAQNTLGQGITSNHLHENFLRLFGNSRFLSHHVIRHPHLFKIYNNSPYKETEKPFGVFEIEATEAMKSSRTLDDAVRELKLYKYQEYVRLTIKELCLFEQNIIYREFAHLALAIGRGLIKKIIAELGERYGVTLFDTGLFAIISMGKLGGLELNYSSDVDLIGLYEDEKKHLNITNHEFFTKLFTKLGQLLGHNDAEGFLYRVDWDLRPEGKSGTLANSLPAMETYYQTFGEDWERQAFIKGGLYFETGHIGLEFLKLMQPFVYKKYVDSKTIERIWNIKSRIISEHAQKEQTGTNIKLCHGGIRDVEFLAQGFQLLFGGKDPDLRCRGTIDTIQELTGKQILPAEEAHVLRAGYLFLRRVESAIQMEAEKQTQILPDDKPERLKIARRLGINGTADHATDIFSEQLQNTLKHIHHLFRKYYER